jgi:hypothetical protein
MSDRYWASLPPEQLATKAMDKWKDWRRYFWESGIGVKADKGRRYYYGLNDMGDASSRVQQGGNQGQYLRVVMNKLRPPVRRMLAMIAAQAPTMQPVAANSDSLAREQAISSKGILEHVHREHDTEELDLEVLEIAMCMGEGARLILWDSAEGPEVEEAGVDPEKQGPAAMAGDFLNDVLTPFDLARDPSVRSRRRHAWVIVRTWENRWEWAARVPEKRDAILAARNLETEFGEPYDYQFANVERLSEGDAIPVYRLFHRATKALPGGRAFTCLNNGTWLEDGQNPYGGGLELPVKSCVSGAVIATSMGYSDVFDVLGLADILNSLLTTTTTHTTRWGIPPLADIQGSGLQHSTVGNGISILTVRSRDHLPEPVAVPPLSPDVYKQIDMVSEEMIQILGMNQTAMGEPPFSGMAAQAMELLNQKAREFADGLTRSFRSYKQACATLELSILKDFARDERIAVIQGKAKRWMLKSFTNKDLAHVSRVAMEPAPAGTGSMAYKWALADMLAQRGMNLTPQELIEIVRTGEFESPFEHEEANRLRIKAENEELQAGRRPAVLLARTHWLDIPEHLALLSSPDVVERPDMVEAVLLTVQEKLAAWRAMPMDLLLLLGGQPAPPPVMPMMPPGAPPEALGEPPQQPQVPQGQGGPVP